MAKRPDISVILLLNRHVVRADFSNKQLDSKRQLFDLEVNPKSPSANFFVNEKVDVESTLSDAVSQVVSGHPPLASRTVVLSTDVWTQIVALPRLSVTDIEPHELQEALKFEAETLSGIDIDEVSLASTPLGAKDDQQQFWVSAIRQSDLDSVNQLLETAACREIAIAHPAGLAGFSLAPNSSSLSEAKTVEVWNELAFHLASHGSKLVAVKQASHEFLRQISLSENAILGDGSVPTRISHSNFATLDNDDALIRFTASVAANYSQRLRDVAAPLIRLTKGSRSTPVRHLLTAAIALAAIGFCFGHWQYVSKLNADLFLQVEATKQPAIEKKKCDSQLISILELRAQVDSEDMRLGDDLKRIRFFLDNQGNRITKLLNLLVELRTDELVIQEIGGNEDGVLISGISLNGESAQSLASRLRENAVPLGWVVNPARQQGQEKLTTGGPWQFDIQLTDTGPFEFAVQSRKKSNATSKSKP